MYVFITLRQCLVQARCQHHVKPMSCPSEESVNVCLYRADVVVAVAKSNVVLTNTCFYHNGAISCPSEDKQHLRHDQQLELPFSLPNRIAHSISKRADEIGQLSVHLQNVIQQNII